MCIKSRLQRETCFQLELIDLMEFQCKCKIYNTVANLYTMQFQSEAYIVEKFPY